MKEKKDQDKTNISDSRNVVQGSNIQANNIHIGDSVVNHYHSTSGKEPSGNADGQLDALRELIGRGKVKQAIERLLVFSKSKDAEIADGVHLLSGEWNKLQKEERLGIISSSESTMRTNKITYRLLGFIRAMEQE